MQGDFKINFDVLRQVVPSITGNIKTIFTSDTNSICIYWCYLDNKNWGDKLNPVIAQFLSGKMPITITEYTKNPHRRPIYAIAGSLLHDDLLPKHLFKDFVIWGPGCISERDKLPGIPREVCAVRGPLTRDNLKKQGISCPEVYGDPALLYPMFYKPAVFKKYRLGIVPHYIDSQNELLKKFVNVEGVKIINIKDPLNDFIDQVCCCERIVSSSLHGIIAADAYNIPSMWIKFSDKVVGGNFKFYDYLYSVGRNNEKPFIIGQKTSLEDMIGAFNKYKINIDLDNLLDKCPFI